MAPPMVQVVHTAFAQAAARPAKLKRKLARAERKRRQHRDGNGGAERHGEGRGNSCPEQTLRYGEDEHKDGSCAGPDADREHHRHHLSPGKRTGKLPRIDDVVARFPWRVMMAVMVMTMIMMTVGMVVVPTVMIVMMVMSAGRPREHALRPCAPPARRASCARAAEAASSADRVRPKRSSHSSRFRAGSTRR